MVGHTDAHLQTLPTDVGRALVSGENPVISMTISPDSPDVQDGTGHVEAYEMGEGYIVEDWGGAEGFTHWAATRRGLEEIFSRYSPESWDEFVHEFDDPPVWVQQIEKRRAESK